MRVVNRAGKSGREAARLLGKCLDDRFTLAQRVRLHGRRNSIDAVLVGPHGVTVLVIASDEGRVRCLGDNWYNWNPNTDKFVASKHNPVKRVQDDRKAIELFLAGRQMGTLVPVECAVLVPQLNAQVEFMQPTVPILDVTQIKEMAETLTGQRELIEWTQANDVLKGLGVPPLGKSWHALIQPGSRKRRLSAVGFGGLKRKQLILLAIIAVADLLVLIGGLTVVLLTR
jgi:Nuclease-related domain